MSGDPGAGKPVVRTSFKQSRTIESFYTGGKTAVTADDQLLISTAGEDVVCLELSNGRTKWKLEGGADALTCFAVKPDSSGLLTASRSLLLKAWDLETGKEERSFRGHEAPVLAMDFDATSTLCATGSADSTVKVWDVGRGYATHNFRGHRGLVTCVKFRPDKKAWWLLYTGGEDGQIRVWDLKKKGCLAVLESHVSVVRGLDLTPNGEYLISGGRDRVVNIWNLGTKELVKTLPVSEGVEAVGLVDHSHLPTKLRSSTKQTDIVFYTGGEKGVVRIWNADRGEVLLAQAAEESSNHQIFEVLYVRDSMALVVVTTDQHFLFYSIREGLQRTKQLVGANDEVIDVCFLGGPDSLALCANSEQVRVYDMNTGDCELLYGHSDVVICIDAAKDGALLVSGAKDKTALLWKRDSGKWRRWGTCTGHTEAIGAVSLSKKSGGFVLTGSQDRTVKMWDLKAAESGKGGAVKKLSSIYTVKAHERDINSIAVAPNDRVFASASQDKTAKLWNAADGSLIATFSGHRRGVWSVQFSPVDQVLATSSGDKTVKLWSLADRSCLRTFEGHLNSVLRVSFMSHGTQVISSGSDGLIKVWNMKTSECTTTLDGGEGKVWALAVAKEGEILASGGGDSVLRLWADMTEEESEQKRKEEEERIVKEQDLANFLHRKDYRGAIALAMDLGQPYRLVKLFKEVIDAAGEAGKETVTGAQEVDEVLKHLDPAGLEKMLLYVRDWNTNSRHARTAQTVLNAILKFFPPSEISGLSKAKEILDALIPYTERHYQHLGELITRSYLMDFTLQSMELLVGDMADEDGEGAPLDALWKDRLDRRREEPSARRADEGDALGEEFWEGSDIEIAEGSLDGDVAGEFVEAEAESGSDDEEGDDEEMEEADGAVAEGVWSDSDDDAGANGHLPNGHMANGIAGPDAASSSSDSSESGSSSEEDGSQGEGSESGSSEEGSEDEE
ncbi:WD40-repeat-containing domain protein [Hyaloraphidium curvatum]|nr:WD40-repeat-containing domain protein [Hyaloraphidium curvatum]